eukprot:7771164-Karenia_brevis.AAC.1
MGYDDLNQSRASMGNVSTASGDTVSKSYLDNALAIFQQQVTTSLQSACSSLVKNSYEAIAGQVDKMDKRLDEHEEEINALKQA